MGTGVGSSVLEVIDAVAAASDTPVPDDIVGRRAGEPVSTYADPTYAASTLGWSAKHDFDATVKSAYH